MNIRDVVASLVRRWYLTLGGLLVTLGLVYLALQVVPPTWEAKASVVLLPPKSTVERGGNPYLQLGGLGPTLDLLRVGLTDQSMVEQMKTVSSTGEFTVVADLTSSAPVVIITAQDRSGGGSIAIRDAVVEQTPVELRRLQESLKIPRSAHITSMLLSQDQEPEKVGKNQIRAVVVAAGGGAVGTVLFVGLIDGTLGSRRRRQRSGRPDSEPPGPNDTASRVVVASEWDRASGSQSGGKVRRASRRSRRARADDKGSATNDNDRGDGGDDLSDRRTVDAARAHRR